MTPATAFRLLFFQSDRAYDFLETRIIPQWIEHWIESQQSGRKWRGCIGKCGYREQFLQSGDGAVRFSHLRCHSSEGFDWRGSADRVFLNRVRSDCSLRES